MQLLRGSTPEAMLDHGDYADFGIAILRGAGPPAQARRVGSVTCRRSVTPRRSFLRYHARPSRPLPHHSFVLQGVETMRKTGEYDAFVSYSHLEDDALAATLQAGLETFARPWYRTRALRVFRDTTNLAASPGLLSEIIRALSVSDWFVLVASEHAARSRWVSEEVSWWMTNRGPERFLIALSGGRMQWKGADFDWERTDALPRVLAGAFAEEPAWVDLRDVKRALALAGHGAPARAGRLGRLRARRQVSDWVADLAAPVRGMPKDDLVGAHLRYRKRTRRVVQAVVSALTALVVVASAAAGVAANELGQARQQARIATSRELAALSGSLLAGHLDVAQLLAVQAYQLDQTPQALAALFQAVTAEPQLVTYLQASGSVSAVSGSADGRVLVAGLANGEVLRWGLPDSRPARIASLSGPVVSVSADHDGGAVVAMSPKGALLWRAGPGARPLRLPAGQEPMAAGISPSGTFAAVASMPADTLSLPPFDVTLYGRRAGIRARAQFPSREDQPDDIAFPSDTQLVAFDDSLGVWNRLSVPALRRVSGSAADSGFAAHTYAAALSPGGSFFSAANGDATLPVWSTRGRPDSPFSPPLLSAPAQGENPTALAINSTGTLIAQADDGSIGISDLSRTPDSASPYTLTGNSVINAGGLAFVGRSDLVSATGDQITLWNLSQYSRIATEAPIRALPHACTLCGAPLPAVRPGGRQVAEVSANQIVTVAGLPSGAAPAVWSDRASDLLGPPIWTKGGSQLLVPMMNGALTWSPGRGLPRARAWPASPAMQSLPATDAQFPPGFARLSASGSRLIEVLADGAILVRNTATGRVTELIPAPRGSDATVTEQGSAAVDPAGRYVVFAGINAVYVTSLETGRTRTLPGDFTDAFAYDGENLLVQRPDGALQIWNASATRLAKTIDGVASTVVVGGPRLAVETRPDGSAVVIDLDSGTLLGPLRLPAGPLLDEMGITMSPDGTSLVTITASAGASGTGELADWQMSPGRWLKAACAAAGHPLTDAEWTQYVGGPPPRQLACGR